MKLSRNQYEKLLTESNFSQFSNMDLLKFLGTLIDAAFELNDSRGALRAIELTRIVSERDLDVQEQFILNYFVGNAWCDLYYRQKPSYQNFLWSSKELENAIIYYRKALNIIGETREGVHPFMVCQALTNLGNQMSHVGRIIEAIEYWNSAISIDPKFAMALGNRGIGLNSYAGSLYDEGHSHILHQFALKDLKQAMNNVHKLQGNAGQGFKRYLDTYLKYPEFENEAEPNLDDWSLGNIEKEVEYRNWCLNNILFLNPLNDLGHYRIAGQDILHLPSIVVVDIEEGPHFYGMFNQMKQEFASARYLFFEAIYSDEPHFSDRGVFLFNTLDYPSYGLATEKIKVAIRMSYSLLDKIAFFVNRYFSLGFEDSDIKFYTVWFKRKSRGGVARDSNGEPEIHERLKDSKNWPIRGLIWLSKDLKNDSALRESLDPDAQMMDQIRHHSEHLYLKVVDGVLSKALTKGLADKPTLLVSKEQLTKAGRKLLKTVRAGLIYLSLAVEWEERRRQKNRDPNKLIVHIRQDKYEDDWKV